MRLQALTLRAEILKLSLLSVSERVPDFASQIIAIMNRRCSDGLASVRSIPSHFRAMTQRRDVAEPSHFVVNTLRPLRAFFEGPGAGAALRTRVGAQWSTEVFESVANRYFTQLAATKKTEESLRRLRQPRRQTTFSLFGGSGNGAQDASKEDERIQAQIVLDVETLGRDAVTLGVDVEASEGYQKLRESAATGWSAAD
jgi:hypothetical protein